MRDFIRLARLVMPGRNIVMLAALLGLLTIGGNVGLMAASAYLITGAALHPPVLELMSAITGVRFFGISRAVFRYFERYVTHDVTFRALSKLRKDFYRVLEPLVPARISGFHSGELLSRFAADVESLQYVYLRLIAPLLVALLVWLCVAIFLLCFHWQLAFWFTCLFVVAGVLLPLGLSYLLCGKGERQAVIKDALNVHLSDGLRGMTELIASNSIIKQSGLINRLGEQLAKEQEAMAKVTAIANALTGFLSQLALWALLICSINLANKGLINEQYVAMLVLAGYASFEAVLPLNMASHYFNEGLRAGRRLFAIIDTPALYRDETEGLPAPTGDYSLRAVNLSFNYGPGEAAVIDNLSFDLPQGKRLAIVGASGAGKSTIINLLLRLWDFREGAILLGGQDIRMHTAEDLRKVMAVVTQFTHLFNTTIRENLSLAKPGASEDELAAALEQAQLSEFIQSLPAGINTHVGENGLKLSGGQRRRLIIARAFLRNAPILLLDEVTSGLDPVTEQEVMATLQKLMAGKTTLLITHRFTGLEAVDEILVLGGGKIVERGTYNELMSQRGMFRRMWELQQVF